MRGPQHPGAPGALPTAKRASQAQERALSLGSSPGFDEDLHLRSCVTLGVALGLGNLSFLIWKMAPSYKRGLS